MQARKIEALGECAARGLKPTKPARLLGATDRLHLFELVLDSRFRLIGQSRPTALLRIVDVTGVIRLQRREAQVLIASAGTIEPLLEPFLDENATFGDSGRELPELFLVYRENIVDLSGLENPKQIVALVRAELEGLPPGDLAFAVAIRR